MTKQGDPLVPALDCISKAWIVYDAHIASVVVCIPWLNVGEAKVPYMPLVN